MKATAATLLSLLWVVAACDMTKVDNSNPRPRSVGATGGPVAEPLQLDEVGDEEETEEPAPVPLPLPGTEPEEEAPPAAAGEAPTEEERDLGQELESAMGSAVSCLGPRAEDSAPEVRVSLTAHVMPSGRVSRGSVSSGGLSSGEIDCMTQRLEQTRLHGPIEDAPRTVSGTLVLTLK